MLLNYRLNTTLLSNVYSLIEVFLIFCCRRQFLSFKIFTGVFFQRDIPSMTFFFDDICNVWSYSFPNFHFWNNVSYNVNQKKNGKPLKYLLGLSIWSISGIICFRSRSFSLLTRWPLQLEHFWWKNEMTWLLAFLLWRMLEKVWIWKLKSFTT